MTFPTPLTPPESGPGKQTFEPLPTTSHAPENGGALGAIQIGETRWVASYTLADKASREMSDQWRAFSARLRGAVKWFYAWDYERPYPKAYPAGFAGLTRHGGGAFDGSATGWSQTFDSDGNAILQLDGLPDDFDLGIGDYVGLKWNTSRRALVRLVLPATALETPGSYSMMVEPPVPVVVEGSGGVVPDDAVAYLNKPTCLMRRMSTDAPPADMDRRGAVNSLTINALQDLQP